MLLKTRGVDDSQYNISICNCRVVDLFLLNATCMRWVGSMCVFTLILELICRNTRSLWNTTAWTGHLWRTEDVPRTWPLTTWLSLTQWTGGRRATSPPSKTRWFILLPPTRKHNFTRPINQKMSICMYTPVEYVEILKFGILCRQYPKYKLPY